MINQPWTKKNWFSYIPLQYKETKPNSGEMRFLQQNESVVFSLNNVSNWSLRDPHRKIYNKAPLVLTSFKDVVELKVYMEHSTGIKLNTFWKYEDPVTGKKVDQITPFFDAMKNARLM